MSKPPRAGEVLVRITHTGVCHTDAFTLSGDDPEGLFPVGARPRRRRRRGRGRRGRHQRQARRPRHPAVHGRMRQVQVLHVGQDQPVPGGARDAGQGPDARRHVALLVRTASRSTTTWARAPSANTRSCRRSRWRRSIRSAPLEKVCLLGCGVTTGIGAVHNTAKVKPGDNVAVFGLGGIGLAVIQGAVMARRRPHHRRRHQSRRSSSSRAQMGATDCVNPKDHDKPIQRGDRRDDRRRRRLQLRVHRQRRRDARGAGVLPQGLGRVGHHRRRRRRARKSARGRSSSSPAASGAARRSAASRAARSCRAWSSRRCAARSQLDPFVTHDLPLERHQRSVRPDARGQVDPHRDPLLSMRTESNRTPASAACRKSGRTLERRLACEMRFGVYLPPQAQRRARAGAVLALGPDLHRAELHHQGRRAALRRRARPDPRRAGHQPARRGRAGCRGLRPRPGRGLLRQRDAGAVVGALPHARLRRRRTAGAGRRSVSRTDGARDQRPFDGRARRAGRARCAIRAAIAACRRSRRSSRRRTCRGARRRSPRTSATTAQRGAQWDAVRTDRRRAANACRCWSTRATPTNSWPRQAAAGSAARGLRRRGPSARPCACGPATTTATTSSPVFIGEHVAWHAAA